MKKVINVFFTISISILTCAVASGQVYLTTNGKATFTSNAPLEIISASSEILSGAIDLESDKFAFRIENKSFIGFNSALQQEHFYENYIETDKYKYSSFQGKIIEKIDTTITESQQVRAKGILSIHGIQQERIIPATIIFDGAVLKVYSEFIVPLEDHNIHIPNVVYQKIAETIDVQIAAELQIKKD